MLSSYVLLHCSGSGVRIITLEPLTIKRSSELFLHSVRYIGIELRRWCQIHSLWSGITLLVLSSGLASIQETSMSLSYAYQPCKSVRICTGSKTCDNV